VSSAHQTGQLEDTEMLGHGGLRYAGVIGQHPHGLFTFAAQALEDRPTGGIGEGVKDGVPPLIGAGLVGLHALGVETISEIRRAYFAQRMTIKAIWRDLHLVAADSLQEASDRLLTFTRFPKGQWKSIRSSNAIERLREEFKRRIRAQTVLPSAETAAMLFWALLVSGQITVRKVDGWRSLGEKPSDQINDLAA
jgi:hypothetical protein